MYNEPKVSVIIVNFNGKNYIEECVDSVLLSLYRNFEIILVDNGSTDGSQELLRKKYGKNRKVKIVLSKINTYYTGGFNLGAKHSKGEKLIILNNDSTIDPLWIRELVKCSSKEKNLIVQPKIFMYGKEKMLDSVGGKFNYFGFGFGIGREIDYGQYDRRHSLDFVVGTAFMIDRKLFQTLKGFDEWYKFHYEDLDLCLRAKKLGAKCVFCHKSIIYHKISLTFKNNIRPAFFTFNVRKNRMQTVIKNFSGIDRIIRLTGLLSFYVLLAIRDLLSFNPSLYFITLKSIGAVIAHNRKHS